MVFAAASLTDVLTEAGREFESESGIRVAFNFAGSNVLAHQLIASGKGDIFFSASGRWMDEVADAGIIDPGSRQSWLSNRLAVVCHPNHADTGPVESPADLPSLGFKWLAVGDPDGVPVGQYARQWMESIKTPSGSLWEEFKGRLIPTPNTRVALAQVSANPDAMAIVYYSDFLSASQPPHLLYLLPEEAAPILNIQYPAAKLARSTASDAADRFLVFLQSQPVRTLFTQHGFLIHPSE